MAWSLSRRGGRADCGELLSSIPEPGAGSAGRCAVDLAAGLLDTLPGQRLRGEGGPGGQAWGSKSPLTLTACRSRMDPTGRSPEARLPPGFGGHQAPVAQGIEQRTSNPKVAGSNPAGGASREAHYGGASGPPPGTRPFTERTSSTSSRRTTLELPPIPAVMFRHTTSRARLSMMTSLRPAGRT